jgi:S-DNA-T family DNA segregation ATPase FtsK/SpoIIIE
MDDRYNLLKKAETRNIKEYNDKFVKRRLNPEKDIGLCLTSCWSLMNLPTDHVGRQRIELPLTRIAQLAEQ